VMFEWPIWLCLRVFNLLGGWHTQGSRFGLGSPGRLQHKHTQNHTQNAVHCKETKGGLMAVRPDNAQTLLTPAEVAALFRVDPKTVTRWAKAGKLTSIRTLGGHRRYLESEVKLLLDGSIPQQRDRRQG